jgi:DNA-binding transcriptional LysR family regulator
MAQAFIRKRGHPTAIARNRQRAVGDRRSDRMDRMASIATFVKIAEAGGFAAAARKLGVSPSTVTTQIQDLEDRLGARLLNRSTRKVSLTEIGRAYYERCLHILADMDDADSAVHAMDAKPTGVLHLNVSITIPFFVAPVIAEFTSLYPDVRVNMMMSDRMVDLVKDGIDLAITTLPVPTSNLIMRRIGSVRLMVYGSPDYFTRRGVPREPADLASHNCLKYAFSSWGSEWRFKSPEGPRAIHISGNMETNSINALKQAAALGQGLILAPDYLVADEVNTGRLVPVLTEYCAPELPITAVYPHRQHLSTNVRSFLDLVNKHARGAEQESAPGELEVPPALLARNGGRPAAQINLMNSRPRHV